MAAWDCAHGFAPLNGSGQSHHRTFCLETALQTPQVPADEWDTPLLQRPNGGRPASNDDGAATDEHEDRQASAPAIPIRNETACSCPAAGVHKAGNGRTSNEVFSQLLMNNREMKESNSLNTETACKPGRAYMRSDTPNPFNIDISAKLSGSGRLSSLARQYTQSRS
jgi:hypothetical protein